MPLRFKGDAGRSPTAHSAKLIKTNSLRTETWALLNYHKVKFASTPFSDR